VIGGGGLLHEPFLEKLDYIYKNKGNYKVIMWGVGSNYHGKISNYILKADLIGLRDYNNTYNYVPCVSCMHPFLDLCKKINPIKEVVIFEHKDISIPINYYPKKNNRYIGETLEEVLSFLSMGNTIITNSYHGLYWGLLMQRRVLVWEPFASRFLYLKPKIQICNRTNWKEMLNCNQTIYIDYLDECRKLNISFCNQITKMLTYE